MKISCPECNAQFSITAALNDTNARAALVQAFKLPRALAEPLIQYLALFRSSGRALSFRRVETLLAELLPMMESGRVTRNRSTRKVSIEDWRTAFNEMVNQRDQGRIKLPLKSNGYLLEVVFSVADKSEAQRERDREKERMNRPRASSDGPLPASVSLSNALAQIRGDARLGLITDAEAAEREQAARQLYDGESP